MVGAVMKNNKKKKHIKTRDWGVVMMLEHTKPGVHKDQKKEKSKKACRGKVKDES